LYLFSSIFPLLQPLSKTFQSTKANLAASSLLVKGVISALEDISYESIFKKCNDTCNTWGIPLTTARNLKLPPLFKHFIQKERKEDLQTFKESIFTPLMKALIGELNSRFCQNDFIIKGIDALCPTSVTFCKIDHIKPIIIKLI
jgi:hypothetical protein